MKQPGIYAHIDPTTYQIRYIGRATNWPKRSHSHLNPSTIYKSDSHHYRWIKQLQHNNLKPIIICIQEFTTITNDELNQAEIYWISYFKSLGSPLTNVTIGGEGNPITEDTKHKISIKLRKPNTKRLQNGRIKQGKDLSHEDLIKAQPHSKSIIDNYNNEYSSIKEASRLLNIRFQKISDVLSGRRRSYKGYTFRYK